MLLALASVGCNYQKKAPECKVLVTSLIQLGERLEEVRYVAAATEVKPNDVTEVMRPFSFAAKKVAGDLKATHPTVASIQALTKTAASAAAALSEQASRMADIAEHMTDSEADSKVVDERKQEVDKIELQIKETCEVTPSKCSELTGVLSRFPAPTDEADVTADATAWMRKLNAWAEQASKLEIQDSTLKQQVASFVKNWQALGVAMNHLVQALEASKKYEALSKSFNDQIGVANKAIAEANAHCATK